MAEPIVLSDEEQIPADLSILDRLIENEDGSFDIAEKPPEEVDPETPIGGSFYDNLAADIPKEVHDALVTTLLNQIDEDKKAREKRDEQYAEGIRRAGLDPDGPAASVDGGSKVVHPALTECCVDFASKIIRELLPLEEPVKYKLRGKPTLRKQTKARRKADHMNWQLLYEAPSFRPEFEKMFTQLPMGGSQYVKTWFDVETNRLEFEFVPIDKMYLPYAARSFYTSQRVTYEESVTKEEVDDRMADGLYREVDLVPPSMVPEPTKAQEKSDKVEGKDSSVTNIDGERAIYWMCVEMTLPAKFKDTESGGKRASYRVSLDRDSRTILEIRRNWKWNDPARLRINWINEFTFIPWRGVYGIGLPHLIGGLAAAMTGALRGLLDSAHVNNFPTAVKIKSGTGAGNQRLNFTGIHEIDGGGADDIRKVLMQMPFNPPSDMLFQLLQWLNEQSKGVVRLSLEDMAMQQTNVPVGTQLSRVEQGMMVFSSIFARLHTSMANVYATVHTLNSMYLPDMVEFGDPEDDEYEAVVTREDYEQVTDMVPVSDPHIFSEQQRFAQLQAVRGIAQASPGQIDDRELVRRELSQLRVPDAETLMTKRAVPKMENQAAENVAMTLGQPVAAFPEQNHLAHIQVLTNFMQDPMLGSNPIIQPTFLPAALQHLKEHIVLWYIDELDQIARQEMGADPTELVDPTDPRMVQALDGLLAAVSNVVHLDVAEYLGGLQPIIAQAMQTMSKIAKDQERAQMDPMSRVAAEDVERRAAQDQTNAQAKAAQIQASRQNNQEDNQTKLATAVISAKVDQEIAEESNETKLDIAAMKPSKTDS